MSDELRARIAQLLGWTVQETHGFSVQMLREMVRDKSPKLAHELAVMIDSGSHILRSPQKFGGRP